MNELNNNAYFWQKLDTLYLSSDFIMTNDKGSRHPVYTHMQYPCVYGHLKTFGGEKDHVIPCFKGSGPKELNQIVVSTDILNKTIEVKLLVGCTDDEQEAILRFLNQTDFQKAILIKRGNSVPSWAETED